MKASRFLNPFQKKVVRTMIIVYLFSLFQIPIIVHAEKPALPVLIENTQVIKSLDVIDPVTDKNKEPQGAMCLLPEEKIVQCDGTSKIVQGYQMITCNESCGGKSSNTIPLERIDEVTYCLKSNTCGKAIKDYCNGLLDTKINQGPKNIKTLKPAQCTNTNDKDTGNNTDESTGEGDTQDPDAVQVREGTVGTPGTSQTNYGCCGGTINTEKPLGQALETYHFTCDSDCKNPGRTIAFNQKFKADNKCDSPESCQQALWRACHRCGVEFEGEKIDIDSTADPLRPKIGKTAADYVAENINRMNQISNLFKTADRTGTYTISNGVKELIGDETYAKIFGSGKLVPKLDTLGKPVLDKNGKEILVPEGSILGKAVEIGQYGMLVIDLINGDYTKFAQSAANIALSALGLPISLDIQGFLDNPVTAYIKLGLQTLNLLVPGLGTAASIVFDLLQKIPGVGEFFDELGEGVKKTRRSVQRWFGYEPRNKTFACSSSCSGPNAGKEMKLKDLEEATGCAGPENCADEMFDFCQGNPLVHKTELVENCHNCSTIIKNAAGQELIPGEREADHFMNMQYQCSGQTCGEKPGTMVSAKQLHTMYNCSETELKKQCKTEGRSNANECFQACIEEASQKYCLGLGGDFVTTESCSARMDDDKFSQDQLYCTAGCGLKEGTELNFNDIKTKYKCTDRESCLYYAKIECMNPGYAKNKNESATIAETTKFCVAEYDNSGTNHFKCSTVCQNQGKQIKLKDLEKDKKCDGPDQCQQYADSFCGGDRTASTCAMSESSNQYSCGLGCKKAPNTAIEKSHLITNYKCQGADCKTLAQQFCEGTIPEPECTVGIGGDGNILIADHYICGEGCKKPEDLQVMKRDLAKQLGCDDSGREGCSEKAIEYCNDKHQGITISDRSRVRVIAEQTLTEMNKYAIYTKTLQKVIPRAKIPLGKEFNVFLETLQRINATAQYGGSFVMNLVKVATSDRKDFDTALANFILIDNLEGDLKAFLEQGKGLQLKEIKGLVDGCSMGVGSVDGKEYGFMGITVNGVTTITQTFGPDILRRMQEKYFKSKPKNGAGGGGTSTNPYVNAGVVPYGSSCPELDEIVETRTKGEQHSAASTPTGYPIDNGASCDIKQSLLDAYCENKLPENYKTEKEDDIIKIIRTDIAKDDLVCSDPFWRDCNPFVEGDEFLVEIYEPVIVPDNDPLKKPGNCRDGIQNHGETGLDCGEVCGTCCDGSSLGCKEKFPGSVQISCGSFTDGDSCASAGCERFLDTSDPDSRVHDYYCTGTPQICSFGDKTSCNAKSNCLRGCESDIKNGN